MPNGNTAPQLTWISVITTIGVAGVVIAGGYKILEVQFDSVRQTSDVLSAHFNEQVALIRHENEQLRDALVARILVLEAQQRDLIAHQAHSPVETQQVNDLSHAMDVRIATMQGQIDDINKQIAASILQGSTLRPK
jgi:hypothetical protein